MRHAPGMVPSQLGVMTMDIHDAEIVCIIDCHNFGLADMNIVARDRWRMIGRQGWLLST